MTISDMANAFLAELRSAGTSFEATSFFDRAGVSDADRAAVQRLLYEGDLITGIPTESWVEHDYSVIDPAITIAGLRHLDAGKSQSPPSINFGSVTSSQIAIGDHNNQSMSVNDLAALKDLAQALGSVDISVLDERDIELTQINVETVNLAASGASVDPGRLRSALLGLRSVAGKLAVGATGSVLADLIEPALAIIP